MKKSSATTGKLLAIAEHIASTYSALPEVESIAIVGSVANGLVDDVSDIDLMLYLQEPLTEVQMKREQQRAVDSGGDIYGGTPEDGFGVWRCVDGVKVDLGFNMIKNTEAIINDVLINHELDNDKHLIVRGIHRSRVLYGEELIRKWKTTMDSFPMELAEKMVRSHIRMTPLWVSRDMSANRDDVMWFSELVLGYVGHLLWILCGLNQQYYPGKLKGLKTNVAEFRITPHNLIERIENILQSYPTNVIPNLSEVINETFDLVDEVMPAVDTSNARDWFMGSVVCTHR